MGRKHGFIPSASNQLERRLVLSQTPTTRGLSVVVSGLQPKQQVLNHRQQSVVAEVNQSFDSFRNDYDQARATYFASILNQPNPGSATTNAFTLYTSQRVALLSQQLMSSFLQSPLSSARAHGQPNSLKLLLSTKIIGTKGEHPKGTLAQALLETIPQPGSSAPTASLYSLSQDNAIDTAQVAVINGVNIIKNSDFGNKTHPHL